MRDVSVTPTESALEAALLESDQIKAHAPPYNVALQEQARSLWFYGPDLEEAHPGPDRDHRVGSTYDRPRVLTTELRRIVTSEPAGGVELCLRAGRVLSTERLVRALAWL